MALSIPITAISNQSLSVVLNNQNCSIDLLSRNGSTFMDLFLNDENILYGRKLSLTPILPYRYLQLLFNGNFALLNNDGNLSQNPNYLFFGISQSLIYYTESDLLTTPILSINPIEASKKRRR